MADIEDKIDKFEERFQEKLEQISHELRELVRIQQKQVSQDARLQDLSNVVKQNSKTIRSLELDRVQFVVFKKQAAWGFGLLSSVIGALITYIIGVN